MRKYIVAFAIIFGLALYVARQDERAAQERTKNTAPLRRGTVSAETNEDHAQENITYTDRNAPGWYSFFRWPNGTTTWAIILTLLAIAEQTAQTAKAAKATEKAVETSDKALSLQEDTAKRQLRAYMGVKGARLFLHEDGSVEPKVEILNSGQTPAYDVHGAHFGRFSRYPVTSPGRPPADTRTSTGIVGAGLPYHLLGNIFPSGEANREGVLNALSRPDIVFCLNGYYTYRDIFKNTHHIEFQMIIGGPSGIPRIDKDDSGIYAVFSNDSVGNDAD